MGPAIPGSIPWQAVRNWAENNNYSVDDLSFLDACMLAMDEVYIKYHQKKAEKK